MKIKILFLFLNIFTLNCLSMDPATRDNLEKAIKGKDVQAVARILNQGISVDSLINSNINTLLNYAILHDAIDVAELLILRGATVNLRDSLRMPPLYYAFSKYHKDLIKFLLRHKADPNIRTVFTPLYLAVQKGDIEMVELLFECGVKVLAENSSDQTIFDYPIPAEMKDLLYARKKIEETSIG